MILEPIRVLTPDNMERIHQAALTILQDVGMKIESEQALDYLRRAGARVDTASHVVRFDRKLVQRYVDKMRADYARRQTPRQMSVRYSHVRFAAEPHRIHPDFTVSAGGFCCFIQDLEGRRRPATLDDVHRAIHMINRLDQVTYTGLPVADQSTPIGLRPVRMAAELAKHTTKFGGIETFSIEDIPYLVEIGTILKGSVEALRAEPILVGYGEARSPLCFDRNMADIFIEYIKRGLPQTLDTMPNGGATAPVTMAGLLALGCAETLGGLILGYAVDENAVVGVDIIPSYCDMQSGIFHYGGIDRMPLLVARVQMISEYYGCPSGVHGGKTDSCFVNLQAGTEKALSTLLPVLAGAVGIGTVGHIENAVTFSPQQLVIDNEIARGVRHILRPIEVSERTLALDVIGKVGIGGNYLEEEHTAEHFREELFLSPLFSTMPWQVARNQGDGHLETKALDIARRIWNQKPEPVLDSERTRAVDAVVEAARRHLVK
jgi:trimethylamine---corrinoid protein Co-methyltransferase